MKNRGKVRFILLTLCCLAALSIGIFALRGLANFAAGGVPPPNVSIFPADHGLPDTIAGYQILAVITSETTACIPPGTARLVLQSDASNAQEARSIDTTAVRRELERLFPDSGFSWEIEIVGPGVTIGEIAVGNAQLNTDYAERDCFTFDPVPTFWATPTPRAAHLILRRETT